MKRQIINRLIRFHNKAQGPYAQKIGPKTKARGMGLSDLGCFYVVKAEIGNPHPEKTNICFNVPPDITSCGIASAINGFSFKVGGVDIQEQAYLGDDGQFCLTFQTRHITNGDGIAPGDDVTYSYTPGTCHKANESDPDCALEEIVDAPVTNSILGIDWARVGDIADNVVIVSAPRDFASIGLNWVVEVDSIGVTITNEEIVNGNIRLTIDRDVNPGETVTVSHTSVTNGAVATNGQSLYQVTDYPVVNAAGVDYWLREDAGAWVTESVGRWQLGV